tara:strand:- start:250 stop:828 length:579 start_codon:yes stop_codon:yes gene_type:complete
MTCRGSRFADGATRNPDGQVFMKNRETDEWLEQNQKATRNFIRKWGHFVKHDEYLKPIIPHKYNIGFAIHNCTKEILHALEPWCSDIFLTMLQPSDVQGYILEEQKNTKFDLLKKIKPISDEKYNDIIVEFEANELTQDNIKILFNIQEIITESGEIGQFEIGIFKITILELKTYEKELIDIKGKKPYMEVA